MLSKLLARKVVINTTSIFAGEAAARLATFAVAVIVARRFGPEALGQYGYAVAAASVLLLIPDAGMHLFMIRELAAFPQRLHSIFWRVLWLKIPLLAAVFGFSIYFGERVIHADGRRVLLYVLMAKVALQTISQATLSVFKAFERMHLVAAAQFANTILAAAWIGLALWANAGLAIVVLALVAGQALETFLGWQIVRKGFVCGPPLWESVRNLGPVLFASLPVGAAVILVALNLRLDILTLSPFASDRDLGTFQAAAWFPVGAYLAISLLMTALFPKLSRHLRSPAAVGDAFVGCLLKNGVLIMAASSALVWLLAPALLELLFGKQLVSAVAVLRLLVVCLPCVFINTVMFHVFVAAGRRGAYLGALVLGASVGATLSLVLSARFGPSGTAFADVVRELLISFAYLGFLKADNFGQSAARALLKVLAGATTLIAAVAFLFGSSIFGSSSGLASSLCLFAGTIAFMGWPRLREMLLIADDDL